jgi:hypothetical protein
LATTAPRVCRQGKNGEGTRPGRRWLAAPGDGWHDAPMRSPSRTRSSSTNLLPSGATAPAPARRRASGATPPPAARRTDLPRTARGAALLTAALLATACGGGSGSGGGSSSGKPIVAPAPKPLAGPPYTLPGAEPLGWLAVAPVAPTAGDHDGEAYWLPADDSAALMLLPDGTPEPPRGAQVLAVPLRGEPVKLVIGERRTVRYGCDDNQLEGVALQGPPGMTAEQLPPPGPVWILPNTSRAAAWKPSGLEVAPTELSPDKRVWTVGPMTFALTVKDRNHATFTAGLGSVWLMQRELERPLMAGADDVRIDLTQLVPGMPQVAAAFSMEPGGPMVIVLATPGYEGTQLSTLLYDGAGLREVEAMQRYLYACAF